MKKAAVVILLLALGIGGAMLFRLPADADRTAWRSQVSAQSIPPVTINREKVVARRVPIQGVPAAPSVRPENERPQNQPQRPAVLQPGARPPLPQLTPFESGTTANSQLPPSTAPQRVTVVDRDTSFPPPVARLHTIVNGDTLERISRRYLGDAMWADAIYRQNRNVITNRERLPLGETIRIPPLEQLSSTSRTTDSGVTKLVPLPQWNAKGPQ